MFYCWFDTVKKGEMSKYKMCGEKSANKIFNMAVSSTFIPDTNSAIIKVSEHAIYHPLFANESGLEMLRDSHGGAGWRGWGEGKSGLSCFGCCHRNLIPDKAGDYLDEKIYNVQLLYYIYIIIIYNNWCYILLFPSILLIYCIIFLTTLSSRRCS